MNTQSKWLGLSLSIFISLPWTVPSTFVYGADRSKKHTLSDKSVKAEPIVLTPQKTIKSAKVGGASPIVLKARFMPSKLRRRPLVGEGKTRLDPFFLPLPAVATNPEKGSDFGILPVVLFFDKGGSGKIEGIFAPSAIYNTKTGFKGAFRWLGYLPKGAKYKLIAIQAIDMDSDYIAQIKAPKIGEEDRFAASLRLRYERDPTKVFFGLGPDSKETGKTGLLLSQFKFSMSFGVNFLKHFRVSYNERLRHAIVEDGGGSTDPFIEDSFPGNAKVGKWETFSVRGIDVMYDNSDSGPTPTKGYVGLVGIEFSQKALGSKQSFTRITGEAKAYIPWPSTQWVSALRVFGSFVDYRHLPHYELSVLGGKDFRGFPSGRFIDRGVILLNLEERIRVVRLEMLRVPFNVEAAPFIEFGQVFNQIEDIGSGKIQTSYGLGIRAVVRPNVVAKIDLGAADEGLNVRVGLDYPF